MDANVLDPIQPYLVGPETVDTSKWLGGKLDFADNAEKFNVVMISGVNLPIAYNPNLVSPAELKSYKNVLDPKWRGKVAMVDPQMAGSGLAAATFFYATPSLGKEFLANLFAAGTVFARDLRQPLEWLARGQYPISLGPSAFEALELRQKGLPIELLGVLHSDHTDRLWADLLVGVRFERVTSTTSEWRRGPLLGGSAGIDLIRAGTHRIGVGATMAMSLDHGALSVAFVYRQ